MPSQQTCLAWGEDFAKSNQSVASWFILSAVSCLVHVGAWNVERAALNGLCMCKVASGYLYLLSRSFFIDAAFREKSKATFCQFTRILKLIR